VVKGFLKGLVRALQYSQQNPNEVVAIAKRELDLGLDDDTALQAIQLYVERISATAPGYADERLMEGFYTYDIKQSLGLPEDHRLPVLHDFGPLLDAYDDLRIPRPR
jgi:ABC-type nitrate/sulfonate/bicarbonate transport system substrate-binding protein